MKRLIDEELEPGSPEHTLAELVRRTPSFERGSFEKERILAGVRLAAAAAPRRRAWAVAAAVLVLSVAAMATAAMGRTWFSRPLAALSSTAPPPAPLATSPPEPPSSEPASDLPLATPAVSDPPAPPPLPRSSRESPSARLGRAVDGRHPEGEDPGPVLEAIRALRSRGDAARASTLLAEYLRAHPRSVLSEDALALSIEAALARHDSRSAGELGRRYLEQFPNGRYKAFASQTVRTSHP